MATCLAVSACSPSGSSLLDLLSDTSGTGRDVPGDSSLLDLSGAARARVRNESGSRADVTLRFIRDANVVHLAFARVLPGNVTTIASPESVDRVELSGIDERGRALSSATFVFGVDFDLDNPAEYVVRDPLIPSQRVDPESPESAETSFVLLEPAHDVTLALGSILLTQWRDSSSTDSAFIRVFLRPLGSADFADMFPVSPAIGVALDGMNDEFVFAIGGVEPGIFEVVGRLEDGDQIVVSVAPGLLEVVRDPFNAAPTISVQSPRFVEQVRSGGALFVAWEDTDPDNNATITFALEASDRVSGPALIAGIGPPIAEDPDGPESDSSLLLIRDVLPGLYDLVATITDGRLTGMDRVEGVVLVLGDPQNDPPALTLLEPAFDQELAAGDSLFVKWSDSDANDNAQISLMLDPDADAHAELDGDEILLISGLGEDDTADQIWLRIPLGTAAAVYRLVAVISDGGGEDAVSRSGGVVYVDTTAVDPGDGGGGPPAGGGGSPPDDVNDDLPPIGVELPPGDAPVALERWFLDNRPHGGELIVEVTTDVTFKEGGVIVAIGSRTVPNDAWPRQFDLVTETMTGDGIEIEVAPRPVWIRQEVEIASFEQVGEPCGGGTTTDEFVGFELTWFGGGFEQNDTARMVQFWLTMDGAIPDDGEDDATHQLVTERRASPNVLRGLRFTQSDQGGDDTGGGDPGSGEATSEANSGPTSPGGGQIFALVRISSSLDSGLYQLVTVFDPNGPDRTVYAPHPEVLEVCNDSG
ncbi:MAG: hypothetical protein IID35_04075 [Planctomycetes bacterium]|nr:hypothetical protein [Planctomycetota bacterium]